MGNALSFVIFTIQSAVTWLAHWEFYGIPFLYFFIGIAIISIIMRFML